MTLQEQAVRAVEELLANDDDVVAAYIFGSTASGTATAFSDVDVALLLREDLDAAQRFRRVLEIGAALEERLDRQIDVVDLRRAPPLLRFRVIQTGMLVVERDRTQRCLFQMHAMNRYYDAKCYLDMQRTATVQRIQQEGLGRGYRGNRDALAEARRLRETFAAASISHFG